jgi:carbohydrate diacid regulator
MFSPALPHVAGVVSQRTAELLKAQVAVLDERGAVIASALPPDLELGDRARCTRLRFRVSLGNRFGDVLITTPGGTEAVPARIARALVDLILSQTTASIDKRHLLKNKLIHDLLTGSYSSEADVLREAQLYGLDLTRPRAVILIDASRYILNRGEADDDLEESEALQRSRRVISGIVGFFHLSNEAICGYIGSGEVAILKASASNELAAWSDGERSERRSWADLEALKRASQGLLERIRRDVQAPISIGIGRYFRGLGGLSRSYEDARTALSLGRRLHGDNGVHCLDGLGVAMFVGTADEATKLDLAMSLLRPLDEEPELLKTLEVFFEENCCPSTTARRLAVHRNTLAYRLDKIAALTGLDPRRFDEAVQIRLTLILRALHRAAA